jgi:hypothetical protein
MNYLDKTPKNPFEEKCDYWEFQHWPTSLANLLRRENDSLRKIGIGPMIFLGSLTKLHMAYPSLCNLAPFFGQVDQGGEKSNQVPLGKKEVGPYFSQGAWQHFLGKNIDGSCNA